jgi:hypothetical protein
MEMSAEAKEYEGANIRANSNQVAASNLFRAGTSIMHGNAKGASLYQRFAGGGPSATGVGLD